MNTTPTHIESLSQEGRGVARIAGKTTFVEGALPGEEVEIEYLRKRSQFDEAKVVNVLQASPERVKPICPHFGVCGGCSLQHISPTLQLKHKEKILLENLRQNGGIVPEELLQPITGPTSGYRRRARLGVKYVAKKGKVLVGFHEKNGRYIAEIQSCAVLPPMFGENITAFADLIQSLSIFDKVPQLEIACGDKVGAVVIRCLQKPSAEDLIKLAEFSRVHLLQIYLQEKGPDSIVFLCGPTDGKLSYRFPDYNLELNFSPVEFVQINREINLKMAATILDLLALNQNDLALDLFCGLGNFTLPMARHCKNVVGVEGSSELIKHARENAKLNSIDNAVFYIADLADEKLTATWLKNSYQKILLDPPRTGALEVCQKIPALKAEKIVYVSCNPATLARDAKVLVASGYKLCKAGVLDMFPHTSHVEAIALFSMHTR